MQKKIESRLAALAGAGGATLLQGVRVGLEKESLRAAPDGAIAQTRHPAALGSALTHPWITTDYSEALLELITPPCDSGVAALEWLDELQTFVYPRLGNEMLWATSMPCVLAGEDQIPIGSYGTSNAGRMKQVYRIGLGYRYGRVMQVIAGVHFNFSLDDVFWSAYQQVLGDDGELRAFRDRAYMGLVRNLLRWGWLVPYLFGASPAVCKSFFADGGTRLPEFDEHTRYEPYATSLRLGDIGYQNRKEKGLGVEICYDSLPAYTAGLERAVTTPAAQWEAIGVNVDGEYRQLNANILQIENEYYSSVRPKPHADRLEMPLMALRGGGISYVELRSLDVNAFHPLGVDETQVRFLEVLMLACALADSPPLGAEGVSESRANLEQVAHQGRDPDCRLSRNGAEIALRDWGMDLLDAMEAVADLYDQRDGGDAYGAAVAAQRDKMCDAGLTPSARMLAEMVANGESFYHLARRLSEQHHRQFNEHTMTAAREAELEQAVSASLQEQQDIEAADRIDFDQFLAEYFAPLYAGRNGEEASGR